MSAQQIQQRRRSDAAAFTAHSRSIYGAIIAASALLAVLNQRRAGAYTAYLATAQERAGAIADAFETVEQALRVNAEEIHRPEIFRLRGELRLKQRQPEFAEADFRQALALSRGMEAKALELRATMSLARLLKSR
jgi:hypothetical protein